MTQANITPLSDPAGAVNDAAFLGSSTAPPTLVFRPGVTFNNNGPIRQNVYTSPNSSGTDGLVLLQETVQGAGFFPVIPLPSSVVELDFSNVSDDFTLTADLNLGLNCTLCGIFNQASGSFPELETSTFTMSAPRELRDVILAGEATSGQVFSTSPTFFAVSGFSSISNPNGFPLYVVTTGTSYLIVKDDAVIGDGTNPVITIPTGAHLQLFLQDFSTLSPGAIPAPSGTGSLVIYAAESATVDPTYWDMAGVTVEQFVGFGPAYFAPGQTAADLNNVAPNFCTTELQWVNYIHNTRTSSVVPGLYYFDFSSNGNAYTQTLNQVEGVPGGEWIGVLDPFTEVTQATAIPQYTIINAASPFEITDLAVVSSTSGAFPAAINYFRLSGHASVHTTANIELWGGGAAPTTIDLTGQSVFGDGTHIVIGAANAKNIVVNLYDGAFLQSNAIAVSNPNTLTINRYSPAAKIGSEYVNTPSTTVIINDLSGAAGPGAIGQNILTSGTTTTVTAGQHSVNGIDASTGAVTVKLPAAGSGQFQGEQHSYFNGSATPNSGFDFVAESIDGSAIILSSQYNTGPVSSYSNPNWGAFITFTWTTAFSEALIGTGYWLQTGS
jgi:hypothetical protein